MSLLALDAVGARSYVAQRFGLPLESVQTTDLGGGVSNHVVRVRTPSGQFVLKQALAKLRVEQDWFSRRERIFTEALALRELGPLLPEGVLPRVLFEDTEQFAFAMSAAPRQENWKTFLLAGEVRPAVAEAIARVHGAMLNLSWLSPHWEALFQDLTAFEQLRLDPYYAATASRHTDLQEHFHAAAERCRTQRVALVHGDWSPKNMMVDTDSVMVIDFEVIHYGDPAFDTAFLLNHLVLKSFHLPRCAQSFCAAAERYWTTLLSTARRELRSDLETGTLQHLPLLLLARMDGKSPVEYITDPARRDAVRRYARHLLASPPRSVATLFHEVPSWV